MGSGLVMLKIQAWHSREGTVGNTGQSSEGISRKVKCLDCFPRCSVEKEMLL